MKLYGICLIMIIFSFISCNIFKPEKIYDKIFYNEYQPFAENTKAVKLTEQSTLKLDNNLPKLDGATALYPLYSAFVQSVYPEGKYPYYQIKGTPIVSCNTTPVAYNNLINGFVDIIFCAKPSEKQIETAREKGIIFNMMPIGREAFVFFVNKRNPVSNLTTGQIINIYTGKITNWAELDGRKNAIKIYQRSENSGSQTMLLSILGDVKIVEPLTENVLDLMGDMVNQVSDYRNYKNALGYSFLYYTTQMVQNNNRIVRKFQFQNKSNIKLLSINNIFPSKETIQNNTYPYSDVFYAITANTENENVDKFIDWILSEQGQYIVELTGYVPLN